jgi:hypothetical protein
MTKKPRTMTQRRRFFSADSFWNRPIPRDARTDARNEQYLKCLATEPTGGVHINASKFTIPVYDVDARTPLRRIRQKATTPEQQAKAVNARREFRHGPGFGPDVPIPDGAVPDPAGDHHAAFVDWERGMAWDVWGGEKLPDGAWESWTGMTYSIDGPGVFRIEDLPAELGDSIHYHGPSRAAGVPAIAGLAMHHEVVAGRIEHKLAMAARHNAYQEFCFPATWTDGRFPGGLPEGAVVQLDPDLDLGPFDLKPGARTIARALQEYGMVNVDGAAGTVVYAEGIYHDPSKSWDGWFDEQELKRIPIERFRVVALPPVTARGDGRRGLRLALPW